MTQEGGESMGTAEDHDLLISLNTKMDQVLETVKGIPGITERVGVLETKTETNCEEISKLRSSNGIWNVLNSLGVFVAGLVGWLAR